MLKILRSASVLDTLFFRYISKLRFYFHYSLFGQCETIPQFTTFTNKILVFTLADYATWQAGTFIPSREHDEFITRLNTLGTLHEPDESSVCL